jgi:hypothetical protein
MKTDPMKKEWRKELRELKRTRRQMDRTIGVYRKTYAKETKARILAQRAAAKELQRGERGVAKDIAIVTKRMQVLEGRLS